MGAIKIVRGKTREICEQIQRKEKFGRLFFTENEEAPTLYTELKGAGGGVDRCLSLHTRAITD